MGYSITFRCRSQILKKKMLLFIEGNYRDPEELLGIKCYIRFSDELSFDKTKTVIGFDYQPCGELALFYLVMVLRWMAIKIGKRSRWKDVGIVPFYYYDGYEKCPIIPNKNYKGRARNNVGFQSFGLNYTDEQKRYLEVLNKLTIEETDKRIFAELRRLDTVWEKQLLKEMKKLKKLKKKKALKAKSANTK